MLTLDGVDAFYGDLQALFEVSLEVRDKEIVALVGANAAGKSTTLRVISGLLAPRRGRTPRGPKSSGCVVKLGSWSASATLSRASQGSP